jgi:bacillithiol system protein YtxJ
MRPGTRGGSGDMDGDNIRFLDSDAALDEALELPRAFLYKHSTRCGTSLRALMEVERFARSGTEIPVFAIDVVRHRSLSNEAAVRLGVRHQSPQAILIEEGTPVWHASHSSITATTLEEKAQERIRS